MNKEILIKLIAFSFCFIIFSCNNNPKPEQKAAPSTVAASQKPGEIKIELASLAMPKDIVCGMSLEHFIGDTATYNGKVYGFCSASCKKDFLADPAKYIQ